MHRKDPTLSYSDKSSQDEQMNGRRCSPNGHLSDDGSATDDSERDDGGMRVGDDYQARIPDLLVGPECRADLLPEKALLVWSPSPDISELKRLSLPVLVDEFISSAKEKYGYNGEQALGMLFWHKHDVEKAIADLPNFTPFPDEWTVEDKVLFEQAFQFHGKSFHRIRQMVRVMLTLPDKSIASLVKYYYSWKKTRCRTSLMDRQARKLASQREEGSEMGSEVGSNSESEADAEKMEEGTATPASGAKTACSNCNVPTSQLHPSPKGGLCSGCHQNARRSANAKPATGAIMKKLDNKDRHNPLKSRRKPPRGMHLTYEDLKAIAVGPQGQGDAILRAMDSEVVALRRQVQNNKQIIGALKRRTTPGIEEFRAPEGGVRLNSRWANDELLLAVQGVRKYGKDFKAIAEVIGNKTEAHVRSFFVNYRRRYNLDAVLQEYEAENGPIETEEKPEKMDIDSAEPAVSSGGADSPASPAIATSSVHSGAPAAPPPLLKPAQSPTIMNRSQHSLQTPPSRLANSKAIPQPPPPLIRPNSHPIMAGMRSSQSTPQLSSRE